MSNLKIIKSEPIGSAGRRVRFRLTFNEKDQPPITVTLVTRFENGYALFALDEILWQLHPRATHMLAAEDGEIVPPIDSETFNVKRTRPKPQVEG